MNGTADTVATSRRTFKDSSRATRAPVTHVATFWNVSIPGWNEALPSIAALAAELVDDGKLIRLAGDGAAVSDVADALWDRLGACVADVVALADDGS